MNALKFICPSINIKGYFYFAQSIWWYVQSKTTSYKRINFFIQLRKLDALAYAPKNVILLAFETLTN